MRTWLVCLAALSAACGGSGGADDGDDDDDGPNTATPGEGPYFTAGSIYDDDISGATPVDNSADITAFMESQHGPNGWGTGEMRIDFSIAVNVAPGGTERLPFEIVEDYYYSDKADEYFKYTNYFKNKSGKKGWYGEAGKKIAAAVGEKVLAAAYFGGDEQALKALNAKKKDIEKLVREIM